MRVRLRILLIQGVELKSGGYDRGLLQVGGRVSIVIRRVIHAKAVAW